MIKNYFITAFRNLLKFKVYSAINIVGLTIGFAAFYLIALYVQFELSFDRYHKNADQIYRIVREEYANTPPAMAPVLKSEFPEVKAVTRIIGSDNTLFSHGEKYFEEKEYFWADPEVFEVFTIPFIKGNPQEALKNPTSIVLSEKLASKYFDQEDPMGKIITLAGQYDFIVSGIIADMPTNSHFRMDAILPAKKFFEVTGNNEDSWGGHYLQTYFLLQEDADAKILEDKFNPVFEECVHTWYPDGRYTSFMTQPIIEIHLHSHRQQEWEANSDIKFIILFSIIAFLILVIACINYVNLTASQIIERTKEVGLRKVMGAIKRQLIGQFLGETLVVTFIAAGLAVILIELILPSFNKLVGREIAITLTKHSLFILLTFSIIFITSLLSGLFPSLYISRLKLNKGLSRSFNIGARRMTLRNILVLVQFTITILLIICTLTVKMQLNFISNLDMGYNREQIVNLRVIDKTIRNNIEILKDKLVQSPDILAVSTCEALPNNITYFNRPAWLNENREQPMACYYNTVSYDYAEVFDIDIVEGRNFSQEFPSDQNGAFLINEAAAKATGWESVLGKEISYWSGVRGPIVGVMKDFHLQSVHSPIVPVYFLLSAQRYDYLSIKLETNNIQESLNYIESVIKEVSPNTPFNYTFFDDEFEQAYIAEQKLATVFSLFSYLAVIIACLGLFGLAAYSTIRREKEIGIRKVSGAAVSTLTLLLSREFTLWVLIANIISWPIAYYLVNKWLQSFAYRISISWEVFLFSGIAALLIALITVSFHTIRAANKNPVDSLRYE